MRIKALILRRQLDRDLEDELAFHLDMRQRSYQAAGVSPDETPGAARRRFGNVTAIKEACRDMWTFTWLESCWRDLRYGLRQLRRSPAFTAVAILSLALGIGANSAMFSVADFLILRPLPVPDPSRVVELRTQVRGQRSEGFSYPDFVDFRNRSRSFEGLVASQLVQLGVAASKNALPQPAFGLLVSDNYFQALGVAPQPGRAFREEDEAVAVISHEFAATAGETVFVDGLPFTVVGVAPKNFAAADGPMRPAIYIPLAMARRLLGADVLERHDQRGLTVRGRLRPGASLAEADAEAKVIARQLEQAYPEANRHRAAAVRTRFQVGLEQFPGNAVVSALLLGLTGIVLLIACGNVANLLLSRARARSREIAVRLSIGAGRGRLLRQLLTESLLVAVAGGALGLLVAEGCVRVFSRINVDSELPLFFDFTLNSRVVLYALIVSLASAVMFGLVPALQAARSDFASALKSGEGDAGPRRRCWGRNLLVVAQVTGSLLLLVCAAQILRGTSSLLASPPGFRTGPLLLAAFNPKLARNTPAQAHEFYHRLLERVRALPGVKTAALARSVPFGLQQSVERIVPEGLELPRGTEFVTVPANVVGEGYFDTLGVPILAGREFLASDKADAPGVAIVNEQFVRKYHAGVGTRFRLGSSKVEIVGVAKQSKYVMPNERPKEFLYLPLAQQPQVELWLLIEAYGDPAALAAPLRAAVHAIDAAQPICHLVTMPRHVERATGALRMTTWIFGAMGFVGLLLSLVGLYGLMTYSVSRRTREIGIRMALGAGHSTVRNMVLRQGLRLAGAGIVIGVLISPALSRALAAATYLPALDLRALLVVPLSLLMVAAVGVYLPARRACLVDPIRMLRQD